MRYSIKVKNNWGGPYVYGPTTVQKMVSRCGQGRFQCPHMEYTLTSRKKRKSISVSWRKPMRECATNKVNRAEQSRAETKFESSPITTWYLSIGSEDWFYSYAIGMIWSSLIVAECLTQLMNITATEEEDNLLQCSFSFITSLSFEKKPASSNINPRFRWDKAEILRVLRTLRWFLHKAPLSPLTWWALWIHCLFLPKPLSQVELLVQLLKLLLLPWKESKFYCRWGGLFLFIKNVSVPLITYEMFLSFHHLMINSTD